MKRLFDIFVSFTGLLLLSPAILFFLLLIWLQDFHSPFYMAPRVAKGGGRFKMVKLRSMVINADKKGGSSTASDDKRITWIGKLVRSCKLDELTQLWNVLIGDMSLVGPRPNTIDDVKLYTQEEQKLLSIRPGITDISSIIFSDEGEILAGSEDPDLRYNQLIRPWKSRLGLIYVDNHSVVLDFKLICWTILAILKKEAALHRIVSLLETLDADPQLKEVARRKTELQPSPPPGAGEIVQSSIGSSTIPDS